MGSVLKFAQNLIHYEGYKSHPVLIESLISMHAAVFWINYSSCKKDYAVKRFRLSTLLPLFKQ